MNDVYGDVPDWRRLVPRERDVTTGRLTGRRDDKRRDDQHDADDQGSSQHTSVTSGRSLASLAGSVSVPAIVPAALAVLAIVVVGGVLGARALGGPGDQDKSRASGATGGVAGAGVTPGTGGSIDSTPGAAVTGAPAEVASAITLEYSGGKLTQDECFDPSGGSGCSRLETDWDPLTVRCTAVGCTVYFVGEGSIDRSLTMSGTTHAAKDGCPETAWTLKLTPVGETVTEGIRHPARIVGEGHAESPGRIIGSRTCLGARETYVFDATPS